MKYQIADKLELPKDAVLGTINIYLIGNYEAYINNYKAIIEYSDSEIKIRGKKNQVNIIGHNLMISEFTKNDMILKGRFLEVKYID